MVDTTSTHGALEPYREPASIPAGRSARLLPLDWLVLIGVYAVAVVYGLDQGALTEHETLVGGVARQMLTEGHWIALRLGDIPWLEKPPLPHWIAAAAIAIGGAEAWVVRLPFALVGFGVVAIVALLSAHWFGRRIGLLAGLIQTTSVYAVRFGRLTEADLLLTFLITVSVGCAAVLTALPDDRRRAIAGWTIGFWITFGLMNLVKGLGFGNGITVIALGSWILLRRDWRLVRRLANPTGILIALLISAAWPAAVAMTGHGAALWADIQAHVLGRIASATFLESHKPWWWYGLTVTLQLAPWAPLLPIGLVLAVLAARRDRRAPDLLLLCWLLAPITALSFVSGKHHHYIMGALPAAAPLLALGLAWATDALGRVGPRWHRAIARLLGVLAWLLLAAGIVVGFLLPDATFGIWAIGAIGWLGLLVIAWATRHNRAAVRIGATIVVATAVFGVFHAPISPNIQNRETDRAFLSTVRSLVPADAPILVTGDGMGRFHFRVDPPLVSRIAPWAARELIGPEPRYVLAPFSVAAEWQGVCITWLGPQPDTPQPLTGGPHRFGLAEMREGC